MNSEVKLTKHSLSDERTPSREEVEFPNVKFVDCHTIGLASPDRCMVIKYAKRGRTEYAGLDLFNGDERVMEGQLYEQYDGGYMMNAIENSRISLDIGDDGNNCSVS